MKRGQVYIFKKRSNNEKYNEFFFLKKYISCKIELNVKKVSMINLKLVNCLTFLLHFKDYRFFTILNYCKVPLNNFFQTYIPLQSVFKYYIYKLINFHSFLLFHLDYTYKLWLFHQDFFRKFYFYFMYKKAKNQEKLFKKDKIIISFVTNFKASQVHIYY